MLSPRESRRGGVREGEGPAWGAESIDVPLTESERGERLRRQVAALVRDDRFELPPMPAVAQELYLASTRPTTSLQELARIAHRDTFIAGRVLRIANTAYYACGRPATTLQEAIVRIGTNELRNIVFVLGMKGDVFRVRDFAELAERAWRHSLATALACGILAKRTKEVPPHRAFLAGLLHDVGLGVVLKASLRVVEERPGDRELVRGSFPAIAGGLHAEVGALVAARWRLDAGLTEAVAHHHAPANATLEPALVTHVAAADEAAREAGFDNGLAPPRWPVPTLRTMGLPDGFAARLVEALPDKLVEYEASSQG